MTSSVERWLIKEQSIQPQHIFSVNQKVYTATEGDGQDMLYVQELLENERYKLRKSEEAGIDVLEQEFLEDNGKEKAIEQRVCIRNPF